MPHPRLDTTHPAHPDFDPADSFHTLRSFLNKPSTRSMTMQTQLSSIQLNIAIHKIGLVLGDFVAFHLIDQDQCKTIMKIVETTLKTPITPEEQIFWEQNEPAMCSV